MRLRPIGAALAVLGGLLAVPAVVAPAHAAETLLSQGKTATASSTENAGTPAAYAVDGNTATRWSSAASDPQWLQVDLGAAAPISKVVLNWEAAYATGYKIQSSLNGTTWTDLQTVTGGDGGIDTLTVTGNGRYVRMLGSTRATGYGYSLWEFQVYGDTGGGTTGPCDAGNAALNKPASASSQQGADLAAKYAFDGNTGTRWSSLSSDPQWVQVDLGSAQDICKIDLNWEAAYGKDFAIQASADGTTWTDLKKVTGATGGVASYDVTGSGRYVRIYGTARGTGYGYSLWEVAVHTTGGGGPQLPGGGDLGPNVKVFDSSMSAATIQSQINQIFTQQEAAQFGNGRYALMFKPGSYDVNVNTGFYTSVYGLGRNPDDVTVKGVSVDAGWFNGNATQNFWRSTENLSVAPYDGTNRWAVAQAAPFRRMHIKGGLNLAPSGYGWASGGYIADSKIDGTVGPYSQQQWYTRESTIGGWTNGVWNMVFSGVEGAPANAFPEPRYTTLNNTPVSREKPYLYLEGNTYKVFVPSKRVNARGTTWAGGATPGTSIGLDQFYVAKPGVTAATLNQALTQGLHLLFTPGIYHLSQTLNVNRADTIVMGLGLATLVPDNGVTAIKVADVDGVKLNGFLIDAGTVNSPTLLEIGRQGVHTDHSANPTSMQDVFVRIGGQFAGKATTSVAVYSDDVIIDHTWLWRADHGSGVGWTVNTADYGLRVYGDDVLATGLFVEHYQKYNVEWLGERGRTIFFQNELPYDPPNQASYMNGGIKGWAAYKVDNAVTTHEGWGLGSYCNFTSDPAIEADHGFEVPVKPNVKFHSVLVVSLGGMGKYNHVINDTGAPASGTATVPSTVTSYP
ncbi:discoidin domain-containing protein [Sphaerisporangium sp. NBC_01403]|uniref:discoidin domain-containing protein n=1 Tax=Sphaerisporangium sp. NBC_01403 TaxID=2903599 RepID=UPI00324509C9